MGQDEQRSRIKGYLTATGVAQPPAVIHRNLRVRGITFSLQTTKRRLRELADTDHVRVVDPSAMGENAELRDVEISERSRVYYLGVKDPD